LTKHLPAITLMFALSLSQATNAQTMQEIQDYCQSMHSGMSEEDARSYIEECIREQSSYLDQETDYQEQQYDTQEYTEPEQAYDEDYAEESYQEPAYEEESSYTPD